MHDAHGLRGGQVVYGSDGTKLGHVLQCDDSGFVVEKGIVFAQDVRVEYEDVATVGVDDVRLRIPSDALLPEEEAEWWDPPRDPQGTAGGVDIEPLRAGMAEIEEKQRQARLGGSATAREEISRRRERVRREALAREARTKQPPTSRRGARESTRDAAAGHVGDAELGERIQQEIDDLERGGGCAARGPQPTPEVPAGDGFVPGEQHAALPPRWTGSRAAAPAPHAPGATASAEPGPSSRCAVPVPVEGPRLDFRRAAPEAIAAMRQLETYVRHCGLEAPLLELVRLRASQLNGCAYCIDMHTKDARRAGETEQRLYTVAVWRETPFFTARERAALAWTEAVTQVGADRVEEDTYRFVREQFGERELVNLTMAVIAINGWNRLAIAFRSEPGSYQPAT